MIGIKRDGRLWGILVLSGWVLLSSCGQNRQSGNPSPVVQNTEAVPTQIPDTFQKPEDRKELASIGEKVPENPYLLKLNKSYWLNRKIWVSLGVERASVTGLAMSVVGYLPATLEREGVFLVLKRQNDGLYGGTTLAPELPLNSYPIVSENDQEMIVDLAQPANGYGLSPMGFSLGMDSNAEIETRLSYVKKIAIQENSISFDTVLSGKSPLKLHDRDDPTIEAMTGQDPYLLAMTLRQDWIVEKENPQFQPRPTALVKQGFFTEAPYVKSDAQGSTLKQYVSYVDFNQPFRWAMSHNTPQEFRQAVREGVLAWNKSFKNEFLEVQEGDPHLAFTDPSISQVVWDDNTAIGMAFANWRSHPYTGQILQAQVYMSGTMWAQNGAQVYRLRKLEAKIRELYKRKSQGVASPSNTGLAKGMEFENGELISLDQVQKELKSLQRELLKSKQDSLEDSKIQRFTIGFNGSQAREEAARNHFCMRSVPGASHHEKEIEMLRESLETLENASSSGLSFEYVSSLPEEFKMPVPASSLSEKEFAAQVVRGVVMHEVGHALGLRHNFIASTTTSDSGRIQSGSIMDYNDLVVDAQFDQPGDSDNFILSQVYPLKDKVEKTPRAFCTDEDARKLVPNCSLHDFGASTLDAHAALIEHNLIMSHFLLRSGNPRGITTLIRAIRSLMPLMRGVLTDTRAGVSLIDPQFREQQERAWKFFADVQGLLGLSIMGMSAEQFKEITIQALLTQVGPMSLKSDFYSGVESSLELVLHDDRRQYTLDTRRAVVDAFLNAQNSSARSMLVKARRMFESRKLIENGLPEFDEEVLLKLQKVLEQGYYREVQE